MAGDVDTGGHAAGIVHRPLEEAVGVRDDQDLLVGHAGQHGVDILGLQTGTVFDVELDAQLHLLAGGQHVAQHEAFVLADGQGRHRVGPFRRAFGVELAVAGHRHDVDDHRGAGLGGQRVGVEDAGAVAGRVAAAARDEGAVDDDRLAFEIAADQVGCGADADPHRLGRDPRGGRRLGAVDRKHRQERAALAAGGVRRGQAGRIPHRRQVDRLRGGRRDRACHIRWP